MNDDAWAKIVDALAAAARWALVAAAAAGALLGPIYYDDYRHIYRGAPNLIVRDTVIDTAFAGLLVAIGVFAVVALMRLVAARRRT